MDNFYINKSIGRGVELKEPIIKYETNYKFISHQYLPQNYCYDAENIHNLYKNDNDYENININIISLDKDEDRRELINDFMDKTDWTEKNTYTYFKAIENKIGWVGCALSHMAIIENAKKNNLDYVIVAEDDFFPLFPKIKNTIFNAIDILNNNDNLDFFNAQPVKDLYNNIDRHIGKNYFKIAGGILAHFYIIHKRAYDKILNFKKYYMNIKDNEYKPFLAFDELINKYLSQFTSYPFFMYQSSVDSNIEKKKSKNLLPINILKEDFIFLEKIKKIKKFNYNENSNICVVCLSCGRFQELLKMVESFYNTNTIDINNFIIIDDSNNKKMLEINNYYEDVNIIQIPENGHSNNLNMAFDLANKLKSKYIFLVEEDWIFTKPFYIEQSKKILKSDNKIINVWLRDLNDTNGHPLNKYNHKNINYLTLEKYYNWHGFTFNPSLKRVKDFINIDFNNFKDDKKHYLMEKKADDYFFINGFYSVILPIAYIYHTGYIPSIPKWLK